MTEPMNRKDTLRCYTVKEVSERLGVHLQTVYLLVKHGKLGAIRIGRKVRIPEDALEEFLATPPVKPVETDPAPRRRVVTKIV